MSGESVAGLGIEAGIGALMLMGTAAGASCAFVVGHGLTALGSHLERGQAEREATRAVTADWDHALHGVALRNARLSLLQGALDGSGPTPQAPQVTLPAPLVLGQQTMAELRSWCDQADARLKDAEAEVVARSAQAIVARAADLAVLADLKVGFDTPDDDQPVAASKQVRNVDETVRADLTRVASRLSADVTARQRETVARAAERVLTARSRIDARNRLADMRERVDQANRDVAARLGQATEAARLLQPLAQAGPSAEPLRADLFRVVAGDAALTPALRERARLAAAEVQRDADRRYVRDSVTDSLAELGYQVDEGFQTAVVKDGVLQVTHGEWNAHGVRMFLDEQKQELRAMVVRTEADGGWDAARVDAERESQWCGIQEELKAKLAAKNISYEVRSATEPGARPVPVVLSGPPSRADTGQARSAARRADQA
jgi:hypothetical protein